jgi:hypothetical protein
VDPSQFTRRQALAFTREWIDALVPRIGSLSDWTPAGLATCVCRLLGGAMQSILLDDVEDVPIDSVPFEKQGEVAARTAGAIFGMLPAVIVGAGMSRDVWMLLCGALYDEAAERIARSGVQMYEAVRPETDEAPS